MPRPHDARRGFRTASRAIQIVATPGSGNGTALGMARELRAALRARGYYARLAVFGDLDRLNHWAAEDRTPCSRLVCVGGDGTLDTVALAAVRRSVPFLAVQSGFGNLFGRALHQPTSVEGALEMLARGELLHADVGVRNGRLFLCHESFGLLADIQSRVENGPRHSGTRWRRHLSYYQMALRHLRDAPLTPLQVSIDGQVVARNAIVVTVANVETYGGWLRLTPDASPVDGLLDVFVMKRASKREVLARLLKRQLRLPGEDPRAMLCRGRRVSVVAPHHRREELSLMPRRLPLLMSSRTAESLARDLARRGKTSPAVYCQVA
jgi:diacylglycerol kinase family enzyme